MRHSLNGFLTAQLPEANVVRFVCYWLLKHRVAVLENSDRYAEFEFGNPKLLLWFCLWQF
jgi:hypothetical protein